jgi:hypothetical protein
MPHGRLRYEIHARFGARRCAWSRRSGTRCRARSRAERRAAVGQAPLAGVAVTGAGIAGRQWAITTLGPYFTGLVLVQPGQTVVSSGPYLWVRHPSSYSRNVTDPWRPHAREPPIWMLVRRTALPLRPRQKADSVAPCPLVPGMDTTCWHAPACPVRRDHPEAGLTRTRKAVASLRRTCRPRTRRCRAGSGRLGNAAGRAPAWGTGASTRCP